jgi:hypothetical protein
MKVKRKYLKKVPDLKEFQELGESLIRSYLKINELYPFKQQVTFELANGSLWYSKHGQVEGAIMGDFLTLDNPDALTSLAMDLQAISYSD